MHSITSHGGVEL